MPDHAWHTRSHKHIPSPCKFFWVWKVEIHIPQFRWRTVGGGANAKPFVNTNALNLVDPVWIVLVRVCRCSTCVETFSGSSCTVSLCSHSIHAGPQGQTHTQIRHKDVSEASLSWWWVTALLLLRKWASLSRRGPSSTSAFVPLFPIWLSLPTSVYKKKSKKTKRAKVNKLLLRGSHI